MINCEHCMHPNYYNNKYPILKCCKCPYETINEFYGVSDEVLKNGIERISNRIRLA